MVETLRNSRFHLTREAERCRTKETTSLYWQTFSYIRNCLIKEKRKYYHKSEQTFDANVQNVTRHIDMEKS